jgi:hypothetical protein
MRSLVSGTPPTMNILVKLELRHNDTEAFP